jgi:hypothetical protein
MITAEKKRGLHVVRPSMIAGHHQTEAMPEAGDQDVLPPFAAHVPFGTYLKSVGLMSAFD